MLVLIDGAEPFADDRFERCLDLFDGDDPAALEAARERWRALGAAGEDGDLLAPVGAGRLGAARLTGMGAIAGCLAPAKSL